MLAEDSNGEGRGHNDCSFMANSAMVLTAVTPFRGCSKDTSTKTENAQNARERTRTTPANQEDGSDGMLAPVARKMVNLTIY